MGEAVERKSAQELFFPKGVDERRQREIDVFGVSEKELPRPRDVDRAELTRPFVDVLEDVAMDRLQMRNVELSS